MTEMSFMPEWSPVLDAAHSDLSPLDRDFRRFALETPALLDRSALQIFDQSKDILKHRLQPWPAFVSRGKIEELKRVSLGISELVRRVPERLFRGRYEALCRFYGLPSASAGETLLQPPNCIPEALARGDFILAADGFKCIEFNFTANLGGWETSILVDLHLSIAATAEFIQRSQARYTYVNTLRVLLRHIASDCLRKGLCRDRMDIVFLLRPEDQGVRVPKARAILNREIELVLQELGSSLQGQVRLSLPEDLTYRDGQIFEGNSRIHAVLEYSGEAADAGIYRCYKADAVSLFNGPIAPLLTDKRNIALLSEFVDSGIFDQGERELIHRCIPWTRRITSGSVEYKGRRAPLPELLREHQEDFVIKQGRSFGGKGVFLGSSTPEAEWRDLIDTTLLDGRWVVQEKVESRPYLFQCGPYGCAAHDVIWGPFVFGETYGGVILRMQPKVERAPVNLSLSATEGIVLEV